MIGLFDTGFLYVLFDDRARLPKDKSGVPKVESCQERIDYLVRTLSEGRSNKIILPAPVLAEFMLLAHDRWNDYLTVIRRRAIFEIAGFDAPESIELVEHWLMHGDGKRLRRDSTDSWAKLKYDRQIAAIAKTRRVDTVYSTDRDIHELCAQMKVKCVDLGDLPLPPPIQLSLVEQPEATAKICGAPDSGLSMRTPLVTVQKDNL